MKSATLSAITVLAWTSLVVAESPVPLLEERFNGDSTATFEMGAEQVKGLSGLEGDLCYFADTATYDPGRRGPIAMIPAPNELQNGQAMTVLLWYKSNAAGQGFGALLLAYGWNLSISDSAANVWLYESREINSRFSAKSGAPWDRTDWTFLVLTWSNPDRKAFFLRGDQKESATVVAEASVRDFPQGITIPGGGRASAGNNYVFGKSPFGGSVDNLRVYDRVLDDEEIEAIRRADLKNSEPVFGR